MGDISKGVASTHWPAKKYTKKTLSYEIVACELSLHLQIELNAGQGMQFFPNCPWSQNKVSHLA
jgi:hypothetical protein